MNSLTPIILAAGASTRMGRPKALLDFDGRTCLEIALDAVRGRLVPRVGKPFGPIENPPASIPLIPGQLEINLVIDDDNTVAYVHQRHLSQWSSTLEDLYPQALENLRKRSSPESWRTFTQAPGILFYVANDSYDASRLLILRDIVSPWPAGGVLAAVPFRDMLVCTRLDGIPALKLAEKMVPIVKGAYDTEGYTISDQLFWTDGETWEAVPVEYAKLGVHINVTERLQRAIESLAGEAKERTV